MSYRGAEWWKYDGWRVTTTNQTTLHPGVLFAEQTLGPGEWRITVKLAAIGDTANPIDPSSLYEIKIADTAYAPLPLTESQQPRGTNEQWFNDEYKFSVSFDRETIVRILLAFDWNFNGLFFGYIQSEGNKFPLPCGCNGK